MNVSFNLLSKLLRNPTQMLPVHDILTHKIDDIRLISGLPRVNETGTSPIVVPMTLS